MDQYALDFNDVSLPIFLQRSGMETTEAVKNKIIRDAFNYVVNNLPTRKRKFLNGLVDWAVHISGVGDKFQLDYPVYGDVENVVIYVNPTYAFPIEEWGDPLVYGEDFVIDSETKSIVSGEKIYKGQKYAVQYKIKKGLDDNFLSIWAQRIVFELARYFCSEGREIINSDFDDTVKSYEAEIDQWVQMQQKPGKLAGMDKIRYLPYGDNRIYKKVQVERAV